jgi:predicted AlkP superfamily pyrophosphatase or phosphodiesterase
MRPTIFILLTLFSLNQLNAQFSKKKEPKLVIGIVVDQMRYDYLSRFYDDLSDKGFKKLMQEGFFHKNAHFNYVPTYTGPGHAAVHTGTTPANNGIIGNDWFDKTSGESVYCVGDPSQETIGTTSKKGKMSPHRLLSTTMADQNRLHTQFRGKTISISIKDRGAILPGGHSANAAYWYEGGKNGDFISSSYYMEELPEWVDDFNQSDIVDEHLKVWNTLLPMNEYDESGSDKNEFEFGFKGKEKATFPYDLKELAKNNGGLDILKYTPYGNDIVAEFAKRAIDGEELGKDDATDFLLVSFSSTDYAGHNFGVNSKEVHDMYLRLDRNLASFIKYLEEKIGKDEFTLFLTADHGAVHVPNYLRSKKIRAGYFDTDKLKVDIEEYINSYFDKDLELIRRISNQQLFFDHQELKANKIKNSNLQTLLTDYLLSYPKVNRVFTRDMIMHGNQTDHVGKLVQRGFHQKRSGDIIYALEPAIISYPPKGSTHGSSMNYDTQIPLIFYGKGIKRGIGLNKRHITDIAPTISVLLGIAFPNANTGNVITEALDKGQR